MKRNFMMYVGLNDKDSKVQEVSETKARKIIAATVGDCTVMNADGFFTHADNTAITEKTLVVNLVDKEQEDIKKYCDTLKKILNQECIMVQEAPKAYFY